MTTDPFYAELQGLLEEKRLNQEALRNLQEADRSIDAKMALLRTRFHQEVIVPTCDAQSLSFNGESFRPFVVQDACPEAVPLHVHPSGLHSEQTRPGQGPRDQPLRSPNPEFPEFR